MFITTYLSFTRSLYTSSFEKVNLPSPWATHTPKIDPSISFNIIELLFSIFTVLHLHSNLSDLLCSRRISGFSNPATGLFSATSGSEHVKTCSELTESGLEHAETGLVSAGIDCCALEGLDSVETCLEHVETRLTELDSAATSFGPVEIGLEHVKICLSDSDSLVTDFDPVETCLEPLETCVTLSAFAVAGLKHVES